MPFLSDAEKSTIAISKMIFHIVGNHLDNAILLEEISPPLFTEFFLDRIRTSLGGNLFQFKDRSEVEVIINNVASGKVNFSDASKDLADKFQSQHERGTSPGAFFLFELQIQSGEKLYCMIKYDNDEVVKYTINNNAAGQVPKLDLFNETFVKKPEALQKIAIVRLASLPGDNGMIAVRDRSNPSHISDYYERFLHAKRVNTERDMTERLAQAAKDTYVKYKDKLSTEIRNGGMARIYNELRKDGTVFDPRNMDVLVASLFGSEAVSGRIRNSFETNIKNNGISEECFKVDPDQIKKPYKKKMQTAEGTVVLYDQEHRPDVKDTEDGRKIITIITTSVREDDVYIDDDKRGGRNVSFLP